MDIAVTLYSALAARGVEVLLDDRDDRPASSSKMLI